MGLRNARRCGSERVRHVCPVCGRRELVIEPSSWAEEEYVAFCGNMRCGYRQVMPNGLYATEDERVQYINRVAEER